MVNWKHNSLLLADNLISILGWLSLWSISDLIIQRYAKKEKHLYFAYITLFLIGCVLLLVFGYPSTNEEVLQATPVHTETLQRLIKELSNRSCANTLPVDDISHNSIL